MNGYRDDLAYIHDAGFSDYVLKAAPGLLQALKRNGIARGLVIDLGCGSGRWARELNRAGYDVFGVDQSSAFIRLARRNAPQSKFAAASLRRMPLPACDAVTSIGECLNYSFDGNAGKAGLRRLFARVNRALRSGGLFIFDVAEPQRVPERGSERRWLQGADWAILVETRGDRTRNVLTRRITSFRKLGKRYRRSEETHRLRLFESAEIGELLRQTGFHQVERFAAFGRFRLPVGITAFLGRK
ncbi:MAG TPA: class I SAM-dependent methyltransferase [Terriglobia bacterium]|nr:class I SAM-dependent methyltransferase [Terriglobia bacterium]